MIKGTQLQSIALFDIHVYPSMQRNHQDIYSYDVALILGN